jgi:hypothetical protein
VAFVENVNGNRVAWTEANWNSFNSFASINDPSNATWGGGFDGQVKSATIAQFETRTGYTFLGYVYI